MLLTRARVDLHYAIAQALRLSDTTVRRIFTPRFELPPIQTIDCPGVESTRFWQENIFRRDYVADVGGRSRTSDCDK